MIENTRIILSFTPYYSYPKLSKEYTLLNHFPGISSEDCKVPVCDYKAKSGRSLDDQNPKADALLQPPEEGALMASTSVFVLEPGEQVGQY